MEHPDSEVRHTTMPTPSLTDQNPVQALTARPSVDRGLGDVMTVFPAALVLNVSDAGRAAEFWSLTLGYVRQQDAPDFLVSTER